ncbi:uncharacterized protein LOC143917668 [Arctopsyche grandis]|uniref:uncharacterized protein LOC143917668 n=1 Tax=Arctopsyche grandis TaxID=121162 RepID=UPI00406D9C76
MNRDTYPVTSVSADIERQQSKSQTTCNVLGGGAPVSVVGVGGLNVNRTNTRVSLQTDCRAAHGTNAFSSFARNNLNIQDAKRRSDKFGGDLPHLGIPPTCSMATLRRTVLESNIKNMKIVVPIQDFTSIR